LHFQNNRDGRSRRSLAYFSFQLLLGALMRTELDLKPLNNVKVLFIYYASRSKDPENEILTQRNEFTDR